MINTKLKDILEEKNVTQKELAAILNVRPNSISDLCGNSRTVLNKELLEKVMLHLEITSFDEILELE